MPTEAAEIPMAEVEEERVLSIQSHVVSGYVGECRDNRHTHGSHADVFLGNRAATFPLQTLGFDVDVINSVQFSNHTGDFAEMHSPNRADAILDVGYGLTRGHKTTAEELKAIFEGLDANGLSLYNRVLTGYIPGAEALQVIADRIESMRAANPNLVYLLDRKPVGKVLGRR